MLERRRGMYMLGSQTRKVTRLLPIILGLAFAGPSRPGNEAGASEAPVRALLDAWGISRELDQYAEFLRTPSQMLGIDPALAPKIFRAVDAAFAKDALLADIVAYILQNATDQQVQRAMEFLKDPLVARFTRLQAEAADPQGQARLQSLAGGPTALPPALPRRALIEKLAGQVAMLMTALLDGFMDWTAEALSPRMGTARVQKPAGISGKGRLDPGVQSAVFGGSQLLYHSVSDDELGRYIAKFEVDPGRWLHRTSEAALRHALDRALARYSQLLAKELGLILQSVPQPARRPAPVSPLPPGLIRQVACRDGGKTLVVLADGWAVTLEVSSGREHLTLLSGYSRQDTRSFALSPDGRVAAALHAPHGGSQRILLWSTDTGQSIWAVPGPPTPVQAMTFTPEARGLVTGGNTIDVFDVASRRRVRELRGAGQMIRVLAVSPDGKLLAAGGNYGHMEVRDLATGAALWQIQNSVSLPSFDDVAFSPDGRLLAACGGQETPVVWTVGTWGNATPWAGGPAERMRVKLRDACRVVFSPDSRRLLETGRALRAGYLRLWDVASVSVLYELLEPDGPSFGVVFGPTGKRFATGNISDAVRVRDASTGKIVRELLGR